MGDTRFLPSGEGMKVRDVIKLETGASAGGRLMRFAIDIEKGPTSYGAYVPDLPGCVAVGKTAAEPES